MVRARGKRERGIMDPALSMHRPGTVQGKKDIRVHDIPFFPLVHVAIKLVPKDIYCQKNSYGRS
jgi:hypothetical protein